LANFAGEQIRLVMSQLFGCLDLLAIKTVKIFSKKPEIISKQVVGIFV